jgi:hypothetical protein
MQNTTHAVMSQRIEASDSLDDFPTPPWASRALIEHIIGKKGLCNMSAWEPACGRGYMSKVLHEYFGEVTSSDIYAYGYGEVSDFLQSTPSDNQHDWVITNPPFKLAEEFVLHGLNVARVGVAVLVRTVFIESKGRYERLFRDTPCSIFGQFVERVPIVKGRVDPKATTATGYAWLIWHKGECNTPKVFWIPPSRKLLERSKDYDVVTRHDETSKDCSPKQPDFFSAAA